MATTVIGYVVHKRNRSKRLSFADILEDLSEPSSKRTEVVLREDRLGPEMLRRWARGGPTKIALGDQVL